MKSQRSTSTPRCCNFNSWPGGSKFDTRTKQARGPRLLGYANQGWQKAFGVKPDQLFVKSFGVVAYLVPVIVNAVGVWVLTIIFLTRDGLDVGLPKNIATFFTQLPRSVVAAFVGAFFLGDVRCVAAVPCRESLPGVVAFTWLRMLIAGSLAPFISALFNNGTGGDAIGFGLGAFPAKTLSDLIQGQVGNRLQISASAAPAEAPTLQALQGITPVLLETLSEADIDSTQDLAYADPLKLFLRTNIPWNVVLDLIDQALLFNYVGDKLKALRVLGIRGSIELSSLHDAFSGGAPSSAGLWGDAYGGTPEERSLAKQAPTRLTTAPPTPLSPTPDRTSALQPSQIV